MGFRKGNKPKGIGGNPFTKEQETFIISLREDQPSRLEWQEISNRFNKVFSDAPRSKGALQVHYSRSLQPSKRNQSRRDRRPDRSSLTSSDYGGDDEDTGSQKGSLNQDLRLPSSSPADRKSKKTRLQTSTSHDNTDSKLKSHNVKEEVHQLLTSKSKFDIEAAKILQNGHKRTRQSMNYVEPPMELDDASSDVLADPMDVFENATDSQTTLTPNGTQSAKSAHWAKHTPADDGGLRHAEMNVAIKDHPYDADDSSSLSDAPHSPSSLDGLLVTAAGQAAVSQTLPSSATSSRSPPIVNTPKFSFGVDSRTRRSAGPSLSTRASVSPSVLPDLSRKSSGTELEDPSTLRSTSQAIPSSGNKRKFHTIEELESSILTAPHKQSSLSPLSAANLPSINTGSSPIVPHTRRSARPHKPTRPRQESLISPMTKVPIVEELQQPTFEEPQLPTKPPARITLKLAIPTHRESALRETQRVPLVSAADRGRTPNDSSTTVGSSAAKKRKTNAPSWGKHPSLSTCQYRTMLTAQQIGTSSTPSHYLTTQTCRSSSAIQESIESSSALAVETHLLCASVRCARESVNHSCHAYLLVVLEVEWHAIRRRK